MYDKHAGQPYSGEYVAAQLEKAGMTLLALRVSGTKPSGLRSFWPEMPNVVEQAERCLPPTAKAITAMDQALGWLGLIQDVRIRRIVGLRALTYPQSDPAKPVYTLKELGAEFGVSDMTARRWCLEGYLLIATALNRPLFCHGAAGTAARAASGRLTAAARSHAAVLAQAQRALETA